MTFDKHAYIDRLKAAGFTEPQARAMADALEQSLRQEVAAKSDGVSSRGEMKNEIAMFKSDLLAAMRARKIALLKWVIMLIVCQTAILTTLTLLGR
jgi:hypothetical protein